MAASNGLFTVTASNRCRPLAEYESDKLFHRLVGWHLGETALVLAGVSSSRRSVVAVSVSVSVSLG